MKIAVCIKQVPVCSEGMMDPQSGVMLREGLETILNVYDLPAIETALRIKEEIGGTVDVFTMGPPKSAEVIREAYSLGADRGYLLSDISFSGADVLATSYTLMQGIMVIQEYDVIICGKQTTDGDTAQVGGAIAGWFKIPHVSWVMKIKRIEKDSITVSQMMEGEIVTVKVAYPCLLSVEPSIFVPRMPSLKLKIESKKKHIQVLSLADIQDQDIENYGLTGSATKVEKIFPAIKTTHHKILQKGSKETVEYIFEVIKNINK
jgi:electron transfer flavoprotein beta subunit